MRLIRILKSKAIMVEKQSALAVFAKPFLTDRNRLGPGFCAKIIQKGSPDERENFF